MPDPTATQHALHTLFHPRAVAVIGASDDTTKHGYIVLNNIRDAGFSGGIYGISRRLAAGERHPLLPRPCIAAGASGRSLPRHPRRGRGASRARLRPRGADGGDRRLRRLCREPRGGRRRTPSGAGAHRRRGGHPHRRPQLQRHLQRAPAALDRLQHLARQAAAGRWHFDLLAFRCVVRRHGRPAAHARSPACRCSPPPATRPTSPCWTTWNTRSAMRRRGSSRC